MRKIAVMGTAGRDKSRDMSLALWQAMRMDLRSRLQLGDRLVSGGAAWADHLCVQAYLEDWVEDLTLELYLPAPITAGRFVGGFGSAGGASAFYHARFSKVIGVDTQREIVRAYRKGAVVHCEAAKHSMAPFFARNAKVAAVATAVVAYTFGEGDLPADGGTLHTWRNSLCEDKTHVSLVRILDAQPSHGPDLFDNSRTSTQKA